MGIVHEISSDSVFEWLDDEFLVDVPRNEVTISLLHAVRTELIRSPECTARADEADGLLLLVVARWLDKLIGFYEQYLIDCPKVYHYKGLCYAKLNSKHAGRCLKFFQRLKLRLEQFSASAPRKLPRAI